LKLQQPHRRPARPASKHPHILPAGILPIIACALLIGCTPRVVRVPVAPEDIIRANDAVQQGEEAFSRNEYYPALIKYLEASRLNPNSEHIFNKLGVAYAQLKFYREAIAAFQRSIGLNSKYPYSYSNLGSVYFAQKENRKAEKNYAKAIRLSAGIALFHVNLGTLYFEMKKYSAAMAEWRKALQLDPNVLKSSEGSSMAAEVDEGGNFQKHYLMARLYASTGDAGRAVESLQKALAGGFNDWNSLEKERDFDPVRGNEKFVEFMKKTRPVLKTQ
jgi:tetratricopeptide (TPR) repeat protein